MLVRIHTQRTEIALLNILDEAWMTGLSLESVVGEKAVATTAQSSSARCASEGELLFSFSQGGFGTAWTTGRHWQRQLNSCFAFSHDIQATSATPKTELL